MANIVTFPSTLRNEADQGMPHIGFSLTGKHKPASTEIDRIHLFIPAGFQVKDGAGYTGIDLGSLTAAKAVKANVESQKTALAGMTTGDATVMSLKAIEGIMNITKSKPLPNANTVVDAELDETDLRSMMNDPRYYDPSKRDEAYYNKVTKLYEKKYG